MYAFCSTYNHHADIERFESEPDVRQLCNSGAHDLSHTLQDCLVAKIVWQTMTIPRSKVASFRIEVSNWIKVNAMAYETHHSGIPQNPIFLQIIRLLYKQRYNYIF